MVPKYTRPEMGRIWSSQHMYDLWLKVEVAVAEAWFEQGDVPDWAMDAIRRSSFVEDDIARYEDEVQHDVIAFLRSVNDSLPEAGRFVHLGLTSNDVKDTALSLQILEALDVILDGVRKLRETIGKLAVQHRDTIMMGRTHGIHAEPVTFGFKLAVWYDDLSRSLAALERIKSDIAIAKVSGAVGTHSNVPVAIETRTAELLGLKVSPAETQVVQRDRHARFVLELTVLASVLDKMATEIRTLQRTEIGEVREPFGEKQAGSSAMPHKRNPILSERVSGLARLVRGYAVPALENIVLWNERDLTNSSLERVLLPDVCIAVDYMLHIFDRVMSGLVVLTDRMRANVDATHGVIFSQRVLRALLDTGMSRDDAYKVTQTAALRAFDEDRSFAELLQENGAGPILSSEDFADLFDYSHFVRHIDETFERTGLSVTA